MLDENGKQYEECIVGNIIGPHYWGEEKRIRYGTKHFRPGAKVYLAFVYGGMGHEQIRVMGKPRKQRRMIDVVIASRYIKNVRASKTYNEKVIAFLQKHRAYNYYSIDEWVKWVGERMNKEHSEVKLSGSEE